MKIRKLQLKNIGVFDNETIKFQPCPAKDKAEIHILTGQNGSGKTTILMALANAFSGSAKSPNLSFDKRLRYKNALQPNLPKDNSEVQIWFDDDTPVGFSENWANSEKNLTFRFNIESVNNNLKNYLKYYAEPEDSPYKLKFAVFAFSGYRQIQSEKIQANQFPKEFNPLSQSLEFIKDYSKENEITINQLVTNNISNRALAKDEGSFSEAEKYAKVIESIEEIIFEITGQQVEFVLKRQPNELKLKVNNNELDFDVLPDGLRSLISWIADLLGRVDLLKWQNDSPIFEKNLILLLDEIEVHLHPAWQRKVLPVVQKLFKNSQIFVSTHSPFVVNSIDDAWVYKLELKDGKAKVAEVVKSEDGISYQTVLSEIFGIDEEFGGKTQEDLNKFYKIIRNGKKINESELLSLAKSLAEQSDELNAIVQIELRQLSRRKGKEFSL